MCLACPCALHVWRAYMLYVPKCFTSSRALRTCVILFFFLLMCLPFLCVLRTFIFCVPSSFYVPSFFTCITYFRFLCAFTFLRALHAFIFSHVLLSLSFYMSYVPSYFYVPYVVSLCLSVSNFWRTFRAFNFCYRMWNNPKHKIFT